MRLRAALLVLLAACGGSVKDASTATDQDIELPGVDTSQFTPRERHEFSQYVRELPAPCKDVAVPVAQCVLERRACAACLPAAQAIAKAVREGMSAGQVESLYKERFDVSSSRSIPVAGSPWRGPEDAPVVFVEFADFECPFCQKIAPELDAIWEKRKDKVRFVYKFLPLPMHPHGDIAARAAIAAAAQGKFWEMDKKLFANGQRLEQSDLEGYAASLGLDMARFRADMDSPEAKARIDADRALGDDLHVRGTPTLFIDGHEYDSKGDMGEWLDQEIAAREVSAVTVEGDVRGIALDACGCFPTGRHYAGIAHLLRAVTRGLLEELAAEAPWAELPIALIDLETTGRDASVDRVVEVGIAIARGGEIVERRNWLVNPGRPIPKEASDVHKITDDDVKDAPAFAAVAAEVAAALEGCLPAAYNAAFDKAFLTNELARAGLPLRRDVEWLDPLVWARELQQGEKSRALGEVAARLGIALDNAHRAIDDAEAALKVLLVLGRDVRVPATYGARSSWSSVGWPWRRRTSDAAPAMARES